MKKITKTYNKIKLGKLLRTCGSDIMEQRMSSGKSEQYENKNGRPVFTKGKGKAK